MIQNRLKLLDVFDPIIAIILLPAIKGLNFTTYFLFA